MMFGTNVHNQRIAATLKYYFTALVIERNSAQSFYISALTPWALRTSLRKNSITKIVSIYGSLKILCDFMSVSLCIHIPPSLLPAEA